MPMRDEVAKDLSDSAHDFLRVVWPVIKEYCREGQLKPVESVAPREFERQLDCYSGIDAWQVVDDVGIRGISSRVQWYPDGSYWPTFTIRKSRHNGTTTELEKRLAALHDRRSGFIRPALIVHAYIKTPRRQGPLNYACMCYADDLFSLATEDKQGPWELMQCRSYEGYSNYGYTWYEKENPQDGNTFAVFPVDALKAHGVKVFEYNAHEHHLTTV